MSMEQLIRVFDTKRDPYMEWHDGPSLQEVDAAMADLAPEERAAASRIVSERIRKGYDPYLGRAAELLGTEECRKALDEMLASRPQATQRNFQITRSFSVSSAENTQSTAPRTAMTAKASAGRRR